MYPAKAVEGSETLSLAQIYGVLHYYHGHQEEVEAYLRQRQQQAEQLRRKIEADSPNPDLRARLLNRRSR